MELIELLLAGLIHTVSCKIPDNEPNSNIYNNMDIQEIIQLEDFIYNLEIRLYKTM
jgi:hypothetical protein